MTQSIDDVVQDLFDNQIITWEGVGQALNIILSYGQIDGEHHKTWVIDQVLRSLVRSEYGKLITAWKDGEDGPDTYEWDEGIAP